MQDTLREECLNTEFFSGLYFAAFGLNTERYEVSVHILSPNAGKYGPEKTRIWTLFTQ